MPRLQSSSSRLAPASSPPSRRRRNHLLHHQHRPRRPTARSRSPRPSTVNAEGDEIRRGIFRDIPTTLINPDSSRLRSNLEVISRHPRRPAPSPTPSSASPTASRIRIGDADVFLDYGTHRYIITLHHDPHGAAASRITTSCSGTPPATTGISRSSRAAATLTLPEGAVISDLVGYTGRVRLDRAGRHHRPASPTTTATLPRHPRARAGRRA